MMKSSFWAINSNAASDFLAVYDDYARGKIEAEEVAFFGKKVYDSGITISGGDAIIDVSGPLMSSALISEEMFFQGTSYEGLIEKVGMANEDEGVQRIVLNIDSPGGSVDGWFEAAEAVYTSEKPVVAYIRGMAASAAYMLATQAGEIIAANDAVSIGSFGVMVRAFSESQLAKAATGVDLVQLSNTSSSDKNVDLGTERGVALLQAELDKLWSTVILPKIARGRKKSEKTIDSGYGNGKMFLAGEALSRQMIDGVGALPIIPTLHEDSMDIKNLGDMQAAHPDLCRELYENAVKAERGRVSQWAAYAGMSASTNEIVVKAIESGREPSVADLTQLEVKRQMQANAVMDNPPEVSTKKAEVSPEEVLAQKGEAHLKELIERNYGGAK